MKKAVIIFLTALIALSAFTGCGSKKQDYDHDDSTRVLYDDNEPDSSKDEEEIEEDESDDEKKEAESSEINGRRSEDESKDSSSSGNGSVVSTAKSSAKTTSSAVSSKTGVVYHVSTKPSNVGSRSSSSYYAASSSYVSTDKDRSSDTDTSSDDPWYSSEIDSSDSDISDSDIIDTDSEDEIVKGSFDYSDTSFTLYDMTISVGDRFADVDELLGVSNSSVDSIYRYDECTIKTNGDEENEIITQITISSPNVAISKDICVGSTTKELLEAFGDPAYGTTYQIGDKSVEFVMINDMVAEIIFS